MLRARRGGRPPVGGGEALTGVLLALHTATPWERPPFEVAGCSGMSCRPRRRAWRDVGLWDNIHRHMLDRPGLAGEIDGSLRPIDDDVTASAIFGAVTMVGLHYVVTGQPIDSDAAAGRLDDLLLGGLAPPTRPRTSTKGRKR